MPPRSRYTLLICVVLFSAFNSIAQFAMPDSVCIGDLKHYYVDSNVVSGSTYAWEIDGVIQIGSTHEIYITWQSIGTYMLEVQELSVGGCIGPKVSGLVYVSEPPEITIEPSSQTTCAGISASFTVVATGSGLTYQWRRGTTNLVDGGNLSGVTTSRLTIYPVSTADGGNDYNVVVSGNCLPILNSIYVSLTLNPLGIHSYDFENPVHAVKIYPNPFSTTLNVVIKDESPVEKCDIMLFNVLSETILITTVTKQVTTLDMGKLPAGVYFYRVIDNKDIIQTGILISQH
jgi:hypothetical protein